MAKTLDKKKLHAVIFNDDQGRAFEQDGQFFRGDGSLWEPAEGAGTEPAAKTAKAGPKAAKEPAAPTATDDQLAQQLGGAA